MKNILTHLLLLLLSSTIAFSQKPEVSEVDSVNRVFVFDFKTKKWDYENEFFRKRKNPYFRIPYKSQPIIKVNDLPPNVVVEIESNLIDIRPESGQTGKDDGKADLTKEKIKMQDSLKTLQGAKFRLQRDTSTMKLSKVRDLQDIDSKIRKLDSAISTIDYKIKNMPVQETRTIYVQTSRMVDSDEVEFIVTFNDSSDAKNNHKTSLYARVFGGLKIDLSTGALFHTVVDKSFHYAPVGNDQSQIAKDKNSSKVKPIFPVVFTNIYWRQAGWLCPGISLGLGIDDSGQSGYYFGPSLILGDRQRAIFSLGGALRPADDLKGKYENGQIFDTADAPDVSDLVESSFKLGLYLSLSYNLTSKVERRK